MEKKPLVAILVGSSSDLSYVEAATKVLEEFEISYEVLVASAHRTPEKVRNYISQAEERGIKVIIAGAGLSAHLPGVCASLTTLPVIGVPLPAGPLNGFDALLSIVQMPRGIPVATVGIGNMANAAYLAISILALSLPEVQNKLKAYRKKLAET
ncbi:MAG: 5-(carboxyamino)imidazole ribonucleotide mutase [Thermodesulfobacteriaceae bacterium]|nr:5-(carboxyamino)imidazole ribonucleotide mutase [Thermodesulfobacteriaceae bacterium]MCX8041778.1 5-(carboxyamino)imidazole ribonucleotide mutase [Thermodesulfobacteriaceae bacterium]MDW8135213.1 5-(carboxyamino)imidazole ribonucleotide mutase [Thermodesulfobacterium sp.]